jgi:hypothetical protein
MPKLKRINLTETVKLNTILGAILGLLAGILYSFGGLIIDTLVTLEIITSNETPGLSYGTYLAFGALIGMPAIGAIFGFFLTLIAAFVYNLFAKK